MWILTPLCLGFDLRPVTFATKSDSEVIIHAYNEKGSVRLKPLELYGCPHDSLSVCGCAGPGFVSALNGIFAFVLLDEAQGQFVVARDHMGMCVLLFHSAFIRTIFCLV